MTACREWKDHLLDAAVGAAPKELEAHLAACPACAAALANWRAQRQQMDAALGVLVRAAEPSPDLRARVLAAVETVPASGQAQPACPSTVRLSLTVPSERRGTELRAPRAKVEGWVGALVAVAVVLLAGMLLDRPATAPRPVTSLSEWRSPTDWLLETPGHELLRSTPRLGDFYFSLEPEKDSSKGGNNEG